MFSPQLIQSICCAEWVKTNTASDNQEGKNIFKFFSIWIIKIHDVILSICNCCQKGFWQFYLHENILLWDKYFKVFLNSENLQRNPINNFPERNKRSSFVGGCTDCFCARSLVQWGFRSNCAQWRRFWASDKIWTVPISPPRLLEQN